MNIEELEKYYCQKPVIKRNNGKLVTTKTSGSFIKKSRSVTRNNLFLNAVIKDTAVNVSLSKLRKNK